MNATRLYAPEKNIIKCETFTVSALKPDQVLIETAFTTISTGTELAWLQHQASTPGVYPWYPGYSGCGRVIEVGEAVTNLDIGQVVAANMPHSSHVVISAHRCHVVSDPPEQLAPLSAFRLASIAMQGVRKAQIQLGEQVTVLGLGAIGLLAAQLAHIAGAGNVVGVDLLTWRRELALDCGVHDVVEHAGAETAEVVIEATGVPSVIALACQSAKEAGRVVLLGSPRGLSNGVDFYTDVHRKGISIIGAHEMHRAVDSRLWEEQDYHDEATVLGLMAQQRLRLDPLISELITPDQAHTAYQRLAQREQQLMLVSIDWSQA